MYTIRNRTQNPRTFIDQAGRTVTVGINKEREVDLSAGDADFLKEQLEADEEISGEPSRLEISGSASKGPPKRVRAQTTQETPLESQGDDVEEEEGGTRAKRGGRKAKTARKSSGRGRKKKVEEEEAVAEE